MSSLHTITTLTAQIGAAEGRLQEAWARRDGDAARQIRAELAGLWPQRRRELAALAAAHPEPSGGYQPPRALRSR